MFWLALIALIVCVVFYGAPAWIIGALFIPFIVFVGLILLLLIIALISAAIMALIK